MIEIKFFCFYIFRALIEYVEDIYKNAQMSDPDAQRKCYGVGKSSFVYTEKNQNLTQLQTKSMCT